MIPAQCGVSLAGSDGLTPNMRTATTVTATPSSSWSRATSRGKRHTLHLWPSSGAGLPPLSLPSFLSDEPFCPCPMSPLVLLQLSVLTTFPALFGVAESASLLPLPAGASSSRSPARLLFENREGSELIWKTFGLDS